MVAGGCGSLYLDMEISTATHPLPRVVLTAPKTIPTLREVFDRVSKLQPR